MLLLLVLLPWVLFGALVEVTGDIKKADALSSALSGEESSGSGGAVPLVLESLLYCSRPAAQNRVPQWRQFLALALCALLLKPLSKLRIRKYYLTYFPQEFFHSLLISLLLGGRAPPCSAY
jgi:hypothetical protein